MYVCMYVCMSCMSGTEYVNTVFPAFAKRTSKNTEFSRFSAKGCRKPKPAKKPAGGIEPGTPVLRPSPRRLRLVERHQIAARYAGGGGGGGG